MNYIKTFAPVVIPTLCRYEHFKRCIESLSKCTWANQTEVYVGLDYPAKDEHWDGYKKIKSYLNTVGNMGFKKITVIERERNYGFGVTGNFKMLINYILSKYDRYIATEDDNIFSPNFLDYINKGLDLYEKDPTILAINGYRQLPDLVVSGNTTIKQNNGFSAWGYGIWKEKYNMMYNDIHNGFFRSIIKDIKALDRIRRNGWSRMKTYCQLYVANEIVITDNVINIYMAAKNLNVIMPVISTVRNCGWDGTGQNCHTNNLELVNAHLNQIIDDKKTFEFKGDPCYAYKINKKILLDQDYSKLSFFTFVKVIVKYIVAKK